MHELNRRDGRARTLGVDDDGRVDAHAVLPMLHEVSPPQVSNVLLQLRACTLVTHFNLIIIIIDLL
jgi:hypothetical protein